MTAQIPDTVIFDDREYVLCVERGGGLFDPSALGLRTEAEITANWRGHVCRYAVRDGSLVLERLRLSLGRDQSAPELFGTAPVSRGTGWSYEDLLVPVAFTGVLGIGRDLRPQAMDGYDPRPEDYGTYLELEFRGGQLLGAPRAISPGAPGSQAAPELPPAVEPDGGFVERLPDLVLTSDLIQGEGAAAEPPETDEDRALVKSVLGGGATPASRPALWEQGGLVDAVRRILRGDPAWLASQLRSEAHTREARGLLERAHDRALVLAVLEGEASSQAHPAAGDDQAVRGAIERVDWRDPDWLDRALQASGDPERRGLIAALREKPPTTEPRGTGCWGEWVEARVAHRYACRGPYDGSEVGIQRQRGAAGSPRAWIAEDRRDGRPVAVCALEGYYPESALESLHYAADAIDRMDHPWLGRFEVAGQLVITPFIEGESLDHLLESGGIENGSTALRLLADVAEAVAALHRAGLAHGSLHPRYVRVRAADGRALLIYDWERERDALDEPFYYLNWAMHFQAGGGYFHLPADHDVYWLGVLSVHLLARQAPAMTGPEPQRPFGPEDATDMLRGRARDVRPSVLDAVVRCVRPEGRWPGAAEVAAALRAALPRRRPAGGPS